MERVFASQHRQINRPTGGPGALQQRGRVQFAVAGPVTGHPDRAGPRRPILQPAGDGQCRPASLGGGQGAAQFAQPLAQFAWVFGHGEVKWKNKGDAMASPELKEGGALRLCRFGPLPLNREVQVGEQSGVSGFPHKADMHTYADNRTPWVGLIRIKGLPVHYSNTAGSARTKINPRLYYNSVDGTWLRVASTFCNKSRRRLLSRASASTACRCCRSNS